MSPWLRDKPLVGVVHLPPSLGYRSCPGVEPALELLDRDLEALREGGIEAVLLENDNDKPHSLTVDEAQVAWLTRLAHHARRRVSGPLGINVQRIDWRASLAVAAAASLDFVRLDVFVDRVVMEGQRVSVDPEAVLARRRQLGIDEVALITDVHVKHAALDSATTLAVSARRASDAGSAVVLVTGARTGEPPDPEALAEAREAASVPVWIGSGLTASGAFRLAPHADGALVGTALKEGERIAQRRVVEVCQAWRSASQP